MKPKVYLETTIVSYLTAWPSRDLVMAANQVSTRQWWETAKGRFELYISQPVVDEARAGDPDAAERRPDELQGIPQLATTQEANILAKALLKEVPWPPKAQTDALHIALAAVHGMNYLVSWNCTHIANATLRLRIEAVCRAAGYEPPIICTPQELQQLTEVDEDA
ncbi:MAG: type II toxin-antitoxin system VapC family toxin [Pirellulales bacterium]